ncbi:Peroxisomal membrane protein PMP27 [Lithohypha guttulata]|uniref:Peroxisomal membrane protein PMP27 n=1 Tax=Lithohypha guttulata TaxID=1690604 RepID=A0AAN7SWS7_9EURO|nr:Peroxisomal membrane protein PMP27 [Lithohypha guttulata]KAK5083546.1 Peroxisomal membrane protein PMP27 [Lithohypha guttulata]KAK5102944.1 Peroxisomal membrane protein PMP27 [Lithohypha guttulata]
MVADALIQHPVVTHYLRYVATTVGRDKILRTIQYFARFYAWYLYRTNNPTSAIQPWATLKNQFGLTRKILRIGKFVEHIRGASELYDVAMKNGSGDKIVQYLQTLRQLGYAGYMLFDTLTVLDAMGVKKYEGAKRLQATAYRFWFTGLTASALAGIYSLYQLNQRTKQIDEKDPDGKMEKVKVAKQRKVANIQLTSDLCDLTVPSTALGYANFDDGIIGLAGTLSSLLGIQGVWAKTA